MKWEAIGRAGLFAAILFGYAQHHAQAAQSWQCFVGLRTGATEQTIVQAETEKAAQAVAVQQYGAQSFGLAACAPLASQGGPAGTGAPGSQARPAGANVAGKPAAVGGQAKQAGQWLFDERGFGPIRLGMSLSEVQRVGGQNIRPSGGYDPGCYTISASGKDGGVVFTFLKQRLVAVQSWGKRPYATAEGVKVGDRETVLLNAYSGRLRVHDPGDHPDRSRTVVALARDPQDRVHSLVFEVPQKGGRIEGVGAVKLPEARDMAEGDKRGPC